MTCHDYQGNAQRFGKDRKGIQRYRCRPCKRMFLDPGYERPLGPMRIPQEKAVFALNCLVEGCSIRTVERLTGLHRDTIMSLLVLAGKRCERLMAIKIRSPGQPSAGG